MATMKKKPAKKISKAAAYAKAEKRSEEHTSELQSH